MQNVDQKVNQRQNTICLEQHIYASPENFIPMLLVMLETFRRSGGQMGDFALRLSYHGEVLLGKYYNEVLNRQIMHL